MFPKISERVRRSNKEITRTGCGNSFCLKQEPKFRQMVKDDKTELRQKMNDDEPLPDTVPRCKIYPKRKL
jgi:hypothetical protein